MPEETEHLRNRVAMLEQAIASHRLAFHASPAQLSEKLLHENELLWLHAPPDKPATPGFTTKPGKLKLRT